jgi:GNAT superfamily N-acetyltransferase
MVLSDLALSRRLERAEGHASTQFVETRARVAPESGAQWIEVAGAYAMFDGPESPITQTFGLGLFEPARAEDLDTIEAFFETLGAPVFHEVSPLADRVLFGMLSERRYRPVEFTSVMFLPLEGRPAAVPATRVRVRITGPDEAELWARTAANGWREAAEYAHLILELARVTAAGADALSFVAELDGRAIATGALSIHEGVALLAGASTVPEERKQGAQRALLEARLSHAAACGCDLAMMCAEPGSASQRNAERQGFRIAYTRIKWRL